MTTLLAGRTELQARGYSRFLPARLTTWLNDAKDQFEDYPFDWPWLKSTATGAAPLTISDLRRVRAVVDTSNRNQLRKVRDADVLEFADYTLATTGVPECWFLTSDTVVAVYPVQTASLSVPYLKFSPALSADGDTPLIPARYHGIWVDLAEVHVLRYGVKDAASAATLEQAALGRIGQVAGVYAMQDTPVLDEMLMTWESCDA